MCAHIKSFLLKTTFEQIRILLDMFYCKTVNSFYDNRTHQPFPFAHFDFRLPTLKYLPPRCNFHISLREVLLHFCSFRKAFSCSSFLIFYLWDDLVVARQRRNDKIGKEMKTRCVLRPNSNEDQGLLAYPSMPFPVLSARANFCQQKCTEKVALNFANYTGSLHAT